jgi:signal transduction histidine kinase
LTPLGLFRYISNKSVFKLAFNLQYLFITCFTFSPILKIYCQPKILQFKHLSEDAGLSSPKVNCALQDYKGFMWIVTFDGLNRYDGSTFITYKRDSVKPGKIAGNYICTIFQDSKNNLLIGTDGRLSLYDSDLNQFKNYISEESPALFNKKFAFKKICEDSIRNLWLATELGVVYYNNASNEKLVGLNASKDKFFSIIAHDLKNPFASILGFCELLTLRYDKMDNSKRKQLLGAVHESSRNLFKLLENLLQWARSQTGSINYGPEKFAVNELIENNILLVENLLTEKKLEIKHNLIHEVEIYADKNMINTFIRNLITNAIKFTENGTISIEVLQDSEKTRVNIADRGVGIESEKVNKIFDVKSLKFTTGNRGESGTGLGLIICKEFIEKNGGKIWKESEVGKAQHFYFPYLTKR